LLPTRNGVANADQIRKAHTEMTALNSARKMLRKVGVEAHHANAMSMWDLRLPKLLRHHGIKTVLDVGANNGGFASDLICGGFSDRILSFEPLPEAWEKLRDRAAFHTNWDVASPMAISNQTGEATFYEAGNSVSSSLLMMTDVHVNAAPVSSTVRSIQVKTNRLDDINLASNDGPYYLKIDVQGAERMVLEGAARVLSTCIIGVQLEMSLATLYGGQSDANELDALLRSYGFECWDILPGFRDPNTFRMLQYDGIYFR
jgi:FkbM family methyltransferase